MHKPKKPSRKLPKVIVVVGATATGKSELAVKLAKKFDGEIISADSRQVYKGLDIGTGKIKKKEMRGVPHHLLGVANPKKKFSVVEFQKLAEKEITEIIERGRIPIICGGTGFYIDAITKGAIYPEVPPNIKLRRELATKSATALFVTLKKLDKERAKNIDPHNKIRIIRAIEIVKAIGFVPKVKKEKQKYEFVKIGIEVPLSTLKNKIKKRVEKMFKSGLMREIKKLRKEGVSKKRLTEFGFEYNEPTRESVILGTVKYAKRQKTWFKRDKEIKWFGAQRTREVLDYVKKKLKRI